MIIKVKKTITETELIEYKNKGMLNVCIIKDLLKDRIIYDISEEVKKHIKISETAIEGFRGESCNELSAEIIVITQENFKEFFTHIRVLENSMVIDNNELLLESVRKIKNLII